jgi:hypothetical protein
VVCSLWFVVAPRLEQVPVSNLKSFEISEGQKQSEISNERTTNNKP